jgi:hypothetical protein
VSFLRVFINLFQFNRTNWKAALLCLIAATVFWTFNALNKEYTSNIKFPLRFEYDLEKASPLEELPTQLSLNVSGNGWQLVSQAVGYKLPVLTIPLEKPLEVKKLVGSTLLPLLADQLGKLHVNFVLTDTLYLHLDQNDKRRLKLFADSKGISYEEGYGRTSPIVILPDSILLQGPKSLLHRLPDSLLVSLPEKKLNSNYRRKIPIVFSGSEMINSNSEEAEVIFEVNEVMLLQLRSTLKIRNLQKGSRLEMQDSLQISIQVPKSKEEDFKNVLPTLALDLKKMKKGEHILKPLVEGIPSYASVVKLDSVLVKIY